MPVRRVIDLSMPLDGRTSFSPGDELPFERFLGRAVVVDARAVASEGVG